LIEKIIKPFITPIKKKIIMPLKRLKNWPKLLAKWIKKTFKAILGQKEITKASYVRFGNTYISKKLIIIVIIVILVLYFFIFIKPPKFINKWLNRKPAITVSANGPASAYSGNAKLVDEKGALLFDGALHNGVYEGDGKIYWPDGTLKEEGSYAKGVLTEGSRYDEEGKLVYSGGFVDDVYEGQGKKYFANGNIDYQGEYKAGLPNGMGRSYAESGTLLYEGGFANGVYAGEGTIYNDAGEMLYQGQFLNGMYNGMGKLLYASGFVRFNGEFSNGKPSGIGSDYYENGSVKYEGGYLAGLYSGTGTLYTDTGEIVYTGGFLGGKYQGEGQLYNSLGLLAYKGLFIGGAINGLGTWYKDDGTVLYQGYFDNGDLALTGYLGLSAVRLEELLGKATSVDILNAPPAELDPGLLDELNTEAFMEGAGEGDGVGGESVGGESDGIAESVSPSLKMKFQELKLAFVVELDESGSGDAAVREVQIGSGPVLDRLADRLKKLAEAEQPAATVAQDGESSVYTWGDHTYTIHQNQQGSPVSGIVR
jgi:antitoxin component YwqK of YwqJK toxin-antitoxin module